MPHVGLRNPMLLYLIDMFIGVYAGTASSDQSNPVTSEYSDCVADITNASFLEPAERLACLDLIYNASRRDFLYCLDGINQRSGAGVSRETIDSFNESMLFLHTLIHDHMIRKEESALLKNILSVWFGRFITQGEASLNEVQQACQLRFDKCIQKFKSDHNLSDDCGLASIQKRFMQAGANHIQDDSSAQVPDWLKQVPECYCASHHHLLLDKNLKINEGLIHHIKQHQDIRMVEELTHCVLNPDQSNVAVVLDEDSRIKNALLLAAHECDATQVVNKLFAHGVDVNNLQANIPLVELLAKFGYHEGLNQLSAENEELNNPSIVADAIERAASHDSVEVLSKLLKHQPNTSVDRPIQAAIFKNNLVTLQVLLNHDRGRSMSPNGIKLASVFNYKAYTLNYILEAIDNKLEDPLPHLYSASSYAAINADEPERISPQQRLSKGCKKRIVQKSECRLWVENNLYEGLAYLSAEQLQSEPGLLEEAVRLGHFKTAQVLIGKGIDVNHSSQGDSSALQLAQESQDLRLTRLLLQAGANREDLTSETRHKLDTDTEQTLQPIDLVRANLHQYLSNFSVDELKQPINNHGQTLLHEAAKYGHLDCVKLLTNKGLDIEARNGREQTPLHLAAKYGHTPIVSHLLEQDAQYDVKDNHDLTPIDLAKKNNHDFMLYSTLDYAIDVGNTQAAKVLLEKANSARLLDKCRQNSEKALHRAVLADSSSKQLIELLVEYGWEINSRQGTSLQTPLHVASQNGDQAAVQCLLEKGADPDRCDWRQNRPQDLTRNQNISQLIDTFKLFSIPKLMTILSNFKSSAEQACPSSSYYGLFANLALKQKQYQVFKALDQFFDATANLDKGFDRIVDQFVDIIKAMAKNRDESKPLHGWTATLNRFYNKVDKNGALQPLKDQLKDTVRPNKFWPGADDAITEQQFEQLRTQLLPSSEQPEESPALQGPSMTGTT